MPTFHLPLNATLYRENNPDSVTHHLESHEVGFDHRVISRREIPTVKAGNLGTMRTSLNIHASADIDTEQGGTRTVPVVLKLESSIPIGLREIDQLGAIDVLRAILDRNTNNELRHFFVNGNLPKDNAGEVIVVNTLLDENQQPNDDESKTA